jgi:hypothetical protein
MYGPEASGPNSYMIIYCTGARYDDNDDYYYVDDYDDCHDDDDDDDDDDTWTNPCITRPQLVYFSQITRIGNIVH